MPTPNLFPHLNKISMPTVLIEIHKSCFMYFTANVLPRVSGVL